MDDINSNIFTEKSRPVHGHQPVESSSLSLTISAVSFIAATVFAARFIAGTSLTLTAKILTGIPIVLAGSTGAAVVAEIAMHIFTGKAQTKDWVFLALTVAGAVIGFFVGGGIPGMVLGALTLPGGIIWLLNFANLLDMRMNGPSIEEAEKQIDDDENLEYTTHAIQLLKDEKNTVVDATQQIYKLAMTRAAAIQEIRLEHASLPRWVPGVVEYFF